MKIAIEVSDDNRELSGKCLKAVLELYKELQKEQKDHSQIALVGELLEDDFHECEKLCKWRESHKFKDGATQHYEFEFRM